MSCVVMYQPYPTSSPYLLPSGPPGPPAHTTSHQLPPQLSGFDRIPSTASGNAVPSATVTPPAVNSPQSPSHQHQQHHHHAQQQQQQQQRLPPTNGLPHGVEPKIEKVKYFFLLIPPLGRKVMMFFHP